MGQYWYAGTYSTCRRIDIGSSIIQWGVGDGKGLMAAFSLGAEGIEMGTRFIATQE